MLKVMENYRFHLNESELQSDMIRFTLGQGHCDYSMNNGQEKSRCREISDDNILRKSWISLHKGAGGEVDERGIWEEKELVTGGWGSIRKCQI